MELTINIEESRFKGTLDQTLGSFTEDELKEIVRKALIQMLSEPRNFSYLFVTEKPESLYGARAYANDVLIEAAKTINFDETFDKLKKSIIQYLEEHHETILKELVMNIFIDGLKKSLVNSEDFIYSLKSKIR